MTKEEIIKLSTINVLNFIIHSMIEHGFLLAHENELSDLKGLIPAYSFAEQSSERYASWALECDLLDIIEDKAVIILRRSMENIQGYICKYALVNSIEFSDDFQNVKVYNQSIKTWKREMKDYPYYSYSAILDGVGRAMYCYGVLIWNLAFQNALGFYDVYYSTMEDFRIWDREIASLNLEDNNARILLELFADIQADAELIEQFKIKYNGKI